MMQPTYLPQRHFGAYIILILLLAYTKCAETTYNFNFNSCYFVPSSDPRCDTASHSNANAAG
eukprot:scaffold559_cov149-Skeletonema_menzelii.AAC.14